MEKHILAIILLWSILIPLKAQEQTKTDPYMNKFGGYGYLLSTDNRSSIWWAEGAYKIMKDTPQPVKKAKKISLESACNEYESFILVIKPSDSLEQFHIQTEMLTDEKGHTISPEQITLRRVEYLNITRPTDSYAFKGFWPDPLPLCRGNQRLNADENNAFWITVKVPQGTVPGDYHGKISLICSSWQQSFPFSLKVWNFTLPKSPSIRSGFGFGTGFSNVINYENLTDSADQRTVFDYYMQAFRDYKINPYNPFQFAPIKETVTGVQWTGGSFDDKEKYDGTFSYKIVDNEVNYDPEGTTKELIPVKGGTDYELRWKYKSKPINHIYTVGVECYDKNKQLMILENRFDKYKVWKDSTVWDQATLPLETLPEEACYIKIRLYACYRTPWGGNTGTVWFDDMQLINLQTKQNELSIGNFEVDVNKMDIDLDFTDFNKAGKKYFDDYGFTGFNLSLKGLGSGTFVSRTPGSFDGFEQGTAQYEKLMSRYLSQIQNDLEKSGWLGKEYIYWFDEPDKKDYPFVRETQELIKRYAPKLTTFITENHFFEEEKDLADITCMIWDKTDQRKINRMNSNDKSCWSYLCCGPRAPWINEFIDSDAINFRMWLWGSYYKKLKGILIWETCYWNANEWPFPKGYIQNPYEETQSYCCYGDVMGKQQKWGNGDGRLFYPNNHHPGIDKTKYVEPPVPSIRLEIMRDGIEDYDYFVILQNAIEHAPKGKQALANSAKKLLNIPSSIYTDEKTYTKNPQELLKYRRKLAEFIVKLQSE